jgi:hypothetical protein
MISMMQCADFIGIAPDELLLCAIPSARHKSLLTSYLFNIKRNCSGWLERGRSSDANGA